MVVFEIIIIWIVVLIVSFGFVLRIIKLKKENESQPIKVLTAIKLLYLTLVLGLLGLFLVESSIFFFTLVIGIITLAILGFFIYMIGKGKNWARVTFLVLFIVGIPFYIGSLFLLTNLVSGIISISQIILEIIALVLLFQKPSSRWFKLMKEDSKELQEKQEEIYQTELIKEKARLRARKEFNQHKKK